MEKAIEQSIFNEQNQTKKRKLSRILKTKQKKTLYRCSQQKHFKKMFIMRETEDT